MLAGPVIWRPAITSPCFIVPMPSLSAFDRKFEKSVAPAPPAALDAAAPAEPVLVPVLAIAWKAAAAAAGRAIVYLLIYAAGRRCAPASACSHPSPSDRPRRSAVLRACP